MNTIKATIAGFIGETAVNIQSEAFSVLIEGICKQAFKVENITESDREYIRKWTVAHLQAKNLIA